MFNMDDDVFFCKGIFSWAGNGNNNYCAFLIIQNKLNCLVLCAAD